MKFVCSTRPMRISVKILLNDICATITQSKVTPIPTYLQTSPPQHTMPLRTHHNKPRSRLPNWHRKLGSTCQYPKHDSSGSNAAITDKHNYSGSNPTITEYAAKVTPAVVTIGVNTKNSRYQGNCQSTHMNNDGTVEAGNETEIICTRVTLLLKVPARNNAGNATWYHLQDFLVQIQQSDMHAKWPPRGNTQPTTLPQYPLSVHMMSTRIFKHWKHIFFIWTQNSTQNCNRCIPPSYSITLTNSPIFKRIWDSGSKRVTTSYIKSHPVWQDNVVGMTRILYMENG